MSENLAYLAGIVDADGYIGIIKAMRSDYGAGYRHNPCVKVVGTDQAMPGFFHEEFGGWMSRRDFNHAIWKDAYYWEAKNGAVVLRVLTALQPFLRLKARQAEIVLELLEASLWNNKWHKGTKGRPRLSDDELARREALYQEIRALNHRGKPPATTKREDTHIG